jgi:phosphopantetheine adenylyltransferase
MQKNEMVENLTQRYEELKNELINIQNDFNLKKDEFIKIQGALEALQSLE